jgi:hypothetical protein
MPKAVVYRGKGVYTGAGEWERNSEITHVVIGHGVTAMKERAFRGCTGLTNLSFLMGSAISIVGVQAFKSSGIITLQGMERVRKIGDRAFAWCKDLRTIEGLGCEEMGRGCFALCTLLESMKGWPASMTVIPVGCFYGCTGMTTVDCDLSHVTFIGVSPSGDHAFAGCTSLLPPSLSAPDANPAAVLAYLKEKSRKERAPGLRYAIYASIRRARDQEEEPRTLSSPTAFAFALAKLPPDMNRVVVEFLHGVVQR